MPISDPSQALRRGETRARCSRTSYAHVFRDDTIKRFNKQIGTVADLVMVDA
jgi:hypothetical protein